MSYITVLLFILSVGNAKCAVLTGFLETPFPTTPLPTTPLPTTFVHPGSCVYEGRIYLNGQQITK